MAQHMSATLTCAFWVLCITPGGRNVKVIQYGRAGIMQFIELGSLSDGMHADY